MPDDVSELPDVFERLKAKRREGWQMPALTFRDASEEMDFRLEIAHVNICANLWKITEYLKVVKKFLDRQALERER